MRQITHKEDAPNPNWERRGGQKPRSTREILTAKFDLPVRTKVPVVVWEFAIRILQPESAGTSIDETLRSRHANVTDE